MSISAYRSFYILLFSSCLLCTEAIDGLLLVLLTWIQHHRGEVGTIGGVREVLALETNSRATGECSTMLPLVAFAPVVGIELHAWFCGVHFQGASALRLGKTGCETELAFFLLVEHIAVVVT